MLSKNKNYINVISLIIISIIMSLPYIIMLVSCFSTNASIKGNQIFSDLSINNLINNFNNLFAYENFVNSLKNSIFVSIMSMVIGVFISSLAGYAYTIYKSKHTNKLFTLSFLSMMIPTSTIVVPLFIMFNTIGILDSYFSIIITSLSLPFSIYLFKQNTRLMPVELIKAARIDGLSEFEIFYKVYIPCMKPVFITTGLLTFVDSWCSLLIPIILIQSQDKFTNSIFLNSLGGIWNSDYAVLMLALVLSTMPIILLFIVFQKQFKNSIAGVH